MILNHISFKTDLQVSNISRVFVNIFGSLSSFLNEPAAQS